MEKCRNLRVGEDCWRKVKLMALDEGVTVREVIERLVHQADVRLPSAIVTTGRVLNQMEDVLGVSREAEPGKTYLVTPSAVKELTYAKDES